MIHEFFFLDSPPTYAPCSLWEVLELLGFPGLTPRLRSAPAEAPVHVVEMNSLTLAKLEAYHAANPCFSAVLAIRPTGWTHTQGAARLDALRPQRRGNVTLYGERLSGCLFSIL